MKSLYISLLVFILSSCSPSTQEDFRYEGESIARSIATELSKVERREDLLKAAPKLQKLFDRLADVMIEARHLQLTEGGDPIEEELGAGGYSMSDQLKDQMIRVCKIEGGDKIMIQLQRDALLRLHRFEEEMAQAGLR